MTYKDPELALRAAYYQRLNGAITYKGEIVPVYDTIADDEDTTFIVIADQFGSHMPENSCSFFASSGLLFEFVRFFPVGVRGSKKETEDIANMFYELVLTKDPAGWVTMDDFMIIDIERESSTYLNEIQEVSGGNVNIYRKQVRLTHNIVQIN